MDKKYMQQALDLASKGRYFAAPNPMVGCVIVKNNQVVASGYHQKCGEHHAEINALEQVNFDASGCDIYVTLEPCSHYGKTPPCVDSIIKAKPNRVIIASLDPNPQVSSIQKMKNAGIEVITEVLESEANHLNRGFFKRMQTGLPFLTAKMAISIDGKIAMQNGESKWITNETSRQSVQLLRAENQAIITGSGTILKDNPHLNVRDNALPSPMKIIASKQTHFDNKLHIFQGKKTIITKKSPDGILTMLGEMQVNNVLLEAGSTLFSSFLQKNLIDELIIYQAPIIMGGSAKNMVDFNLEAMSDKITLQLTTIEKIDSDIKLVYKK
jgi:diaminohydroxyphosphoribosylaminopyrimidine deaminase/5-amino-6-(5-phosphoribosylamino)uracil reductase